MHFIIERDIFLPALQYAAERCKATDLEITKHLLLTAADRKVTALGHNLTSCSSAAAAAEIKKKGGCAAPLRLVQLVGAMAHGAQIECKLGDRQLEVKCGRSRYKLQTLDADSFPAPLKSDGPSIELGETCADLFLRPQFAMSKTESRQYLKGVYLNTEGGVLVAAGTDGHRMIRVRSEIATDATVGIIIPPEAANACAAACMAGGSIAWDARIISAETEGRYYASALIDGTYPDVNRVISNAPADGPHLACDRAELLAAIDRLALVYESGGGIVLSWEANPTEIVASLAGAGEGHETIGCHPSEGPAGEIAFPPDQFSELLRALKGETVHLYAPSKSNPLRIVDPDEPGTVAIQMPCMPKLRAVA